MSYKMEEVGAASTHANNCILEYIYIEHFGMYIIYRDMSRWLPAVRGRRDSQMIQVV